MERFLRYFRFRRRQGYRRLGEARRDIAVTLAEVRRWGQSMSHLLASSEGCAVFLEYLKTQSAEILLEFWLQVEILRNETDPGDVRQMCHFIYREYVHELDCGVELIAEIRGSLRNPTVTMYDNAQMSVAGFLEDNFYTQFLGSVEYTGLLEDLA